MWDRYTVRRKLNSFSRKRSWTWAPALPIRAWVIPTSRCNLMCRTCGRDQLSEEQFQFMDMPEAVYERVRRELLPGLQEVYLTGGGESFVAPIFYRMLDELLTPDRRVWIVTNGTILRPEYLERIVRAPAVLRVSLDGLSDEVMRHIRGIGLDRVIRFLDTIQEIAARGRHPGFSLELSWVVTRSNVEQMPDAVDLAARYGATMVNFQSFRVAGRLDAFAHEESLIDAPEIVRPWWQKAFERGLARGVAVPPVVFTPRQYEVDPRQVPIPRNGDRIPQCPIPWWSTLIETNGTVRACCLFPQHEILGNVLEQPFRAIWNGAKYRELRRTVNTAEMPEACRYCIMPVRI